MQVPLLLMILTILYIKFSIILTTHVFFIPSHQSLYQYKITKKLSFLCYTSIFVMLIYLLTNPLFASSFLLLNSLRSIVNLILRISNKAYIVYRHAAESSNRIAFFLLIKTFNRYKVFNSYIYDYVFIIELESSNVLIARRQTHQKIHIRDQYKFCKKQKSNQRL